MPPEFSHRAFICCCPKDERFGLKLLLHLQHYKVPRTLLRRYPQLPRSLNPVAFDNLEDFGLLTNKVLPELLASSRHLIVICSAAANQPNADGRFPLDEVIRSFISLRPENHQHIIPILLREDGSTRVADCLPPALREHDILAHDLLTMGRERVYADVVAKLLQLKPDFLWDRCPGFRPRRRLRKLAAAAATLLAAAAGWWCWDYYTPHTHYYTDYIERDNLPEGLFPLSDQQVQARHRHYRFTTHKRRVRTVEYCDSAGTPQNHTELWNRERSARLEWQYGEDGEAAACLHRDAEGAPITQRRFFPGGVDFVLQIDKDGHSRELAGPALLMTGAEGVTPPGEPTLVSRFATTREEEGENKGIVRQELFRQASSATPTPDALGLGGREYGLDSLGRVTTIRYLAHPAADGTPVQPAETRSGIGGYHLSYTEQGQLAAITCMSKDGNPTLHEEQWAEIRLRYNAHGNAVELICLDTDGKPCLNKEGYARMTTQYDEQGRITETAWFDTHGHPVQQGQGISRLCTRYDEAGNVIETQEYAHAADSGYTCRTQRFDTAGRILEENCVDEEGKPCLNNEGYARATVRYDERGNVLELACFGTNGKPCMSAKGYARMRLSYDAQGNIIERSYEGADGKPVLGKKGYARRTTRYDEKGNILEQSYYGADGQPCLSKDGCARVSFRYNAQGHRVEETYFGTDGKPIDIKEGYTRAVTEYDADGRATGASFYQTNGEYSSCRYDAAGNTIEETTHRTDGTPARTEKHDAAGRRREETVYRADGTRLATRRFDTQEKPVEISYYGEDGQPGLHAEGYATVRLRFDAAGNQLEESYHGLDGALCELEDGTARIIWVYGKDGSLKALISYNAAGKEVAREGDISEEERRLLDALLK